MKKIFLLYFFLLMVLQGLAQQDFDIKQLLVKGGPGTGLVHDYAGLLSEDQKQQLETKLVNFDNSTSNQIVVLTVLSMQGNDIADYAVELGRAWGVGGKQFNNGIILLIAKNDRKLHIATGYGLEGAIPDVTASQIIQELIKPNFRNGDYNAGINQGVDALMAAAQGKYNIAREYGGRSISFGTLLLIGIFIFIVIVIISRNSGGGRGGSFMSRRGHRGFSGPFIWPSSGGGGWTGSGNWGGGGSSGGFGGFGGGSFGGGGASGDW